MSKALWEDVRDILNTFPLKFDSEIIQNLSCAICKGIMIDANQLMCGCKFCRRCIEKYFKDGGRRCPVNDNGDCSVNFKSMDDVHSESDCNDAILSLIVKCPTKDCNAESSLKDMVVHWVECRSKYGSSISKIILPIIDNTSHENLVVKDIASKGKAASDIKAPKCNADTMEELQIQISSLKRKNKKLEKTVEEMNKRVNCLERDKAKSDHAVDILVEALHSLEERFEDEKHDPFVWVIENFAQSRDERDCLLSEPFFVFKNGYKMRLVMYPQSSYDERYVSLYFELVRGEYDSLLDWPFRYNVTFTVVAQKGGDNHSFTVYYLHHKGRDYAYQRPFRSHNIPLGASEFIEYSNLDGSLLNDGIMILMCSVTKSPSALALEE